jgi:hypothetical protein
MTAGWSSALRSWVQIPVVSRGFYDEHLHLLTSHGCLYNIIIYLIYRLNDLCMFIRYLVSMTQVLKGTKFGLNNWCESKNLFILSSLDDHCGQKVKLTESTQLATQILVAKLS